jgi:hypothetical protein
MWIGNYPRLQREIAHVLDVPVQILIQADNRRFRFWPNLEARMRGVSVKESGYYRPVANCSLGRGSVRD